MGIQKNRNTEKEGIQLNTFMAEDFLLETETAKQLYEQVEKQPIFDFHNHLSAQEIYEDKGYQTITEVWLYGDHYKWRAMRAMGISEELITGPASDRERFDAWAATVPNLIGNPLYHWTHLELKRYFGCDLTVCPEYADAIWDLTKEKLENGLTARKLLELQRVEVVGTTDDPADTLKWHQKLKEEGYPIQVCPTFRPDRALGIEKPDFPEYITKLEEAAGQRVTDFTGLVEVLEGRLDFFKELGCVASDHSLERWIFSPMFREGAKFGESAKSGQAGKPGEASWAAQVFRRRLEGEALNEEEIGCYRSALLLELGRLYAKKGIVMQLHIGAVRNQSERLYRRLGADIGCDGMDDQSVARELTAFLSALDQENLLPKTVLYGLNPQMNEMLAVLAGSFGGAGVRCKVQLGPAWWFSDHKKGMEEQLECFANVSALSGFIGMTTDSRSFLSFTRHEYFRRIFCNLVGAWVERGEYPGKTPSEQARLTELVKGVCGENARAFFQRER